MTRHIYIDYSVTEQEVIELSQYQDTVNNLENIIKS